MVKEYYYFTSLVKESSEALTDARFGALDEREERLHVTRERTLALLLCALSCSEHRSDTLP